MIASASYSITRIDGFANTFNRIVRQFLLVVLMYVYLYNPIFLVLGIGSIKLLVIVASGYTLINHRVIINLIMQFKREVIFTFVIIIYASLTVIRCDVSMIYVPYSHFMWLLECIFLPVVLVVWFRKEFARYNWETWVITAGFIAATITIVLILNPEWNEFVRSSLISYSLAGDEKFWFRGFGIAEGLVGSYGVIQGIILGMCLYMVSRHALYAVPVIPLLISIAFNARTGFVAVMTSLLLVIAWHRFSIRLTAVIIGVVLLLVYVLNSKTDFIYNNLKTIEWATSSVTQTVDFASGNTSDDTVLDTLANEMFYPTSTIGLLFGEGVLEFQGKKSDSGYSNQLMFGGIVYLLLHLSFLAYMYIRVIRKKTEGFYAAFFLIVLLIVNIKYNSLFIPSGAFRLFSLYYVLLISTRFQLSQKSSSR